MPCSNAAKTRNPLKFAGVPPGGIFPKEGADVWWGKCPAFKQQRGNRRHRTLPLVLPPGESLSIRAISHAPCGSLWAQLSSCTKLQVHNILHCLERTTNPATATGDMYRQRNCRLHFTRHVHSRHPPAATEWSVGMRYIPHKTGDVDGRRLSCDWRRSVVAAVVARTVGELSLNTLDVNK